VTVAAFACQPWPARQRASTLPQHLSTAEDIIHLTHLVGSCSLHLPAQPSNIDNAENQKDPFWI
jgi:hypothetical protein